MSQREPLSVVQCAAIGVGIFCLSLVLAKGNILIFAGPLGLWVAAVSLPRTRNREVSRYPSRARRRKRTTKTAGSTFAWRAWLTAAVWIATAVILAPKLMQAPMNDAGIATAMQRAAALFEKGEYEEALAGFWAIEIPECFPNRQAQKYHNIGLIQLRLGRLAEAESALQKAMLYDPKDFDAYRLLVHMAYEAKQYSKALKYLRQAESQAASTSPPEAFALLKAELQRLAQTP